MHRCGTEPGYEVQNQKLLRANRPFYFPGDKISDFEEALVEVDDAYPFEDLKQREIARLDTLLTRAYNELVNSMVGPDPDTWYFVVSAEPAAACSPERKHGEKICTKTFFTVKKSS